MAKLIRDRSTPEKDEWWKAVQRSARMAPTLTYEREGRMEINIDALFKELANIIANGPVWPGDVISHKTADECVRRGWAERDGGCFVSTAAGDILADMYGLMGND